MSKSVTTVLAGACFFMLAPLAAQAQQKPLPAGDGKEMVEAICTSCHKISNIQRSSGYTHEGWQELILTMIDLSQTDDFKTISKYLAKNFPENNKRSPKLVPGDVKISFHEWTVPTLGQRSRDPLEADDGSIWWAGQWADLIGRIDPKTGEMKEYTLPTGAKPHSVFADNDGNVWYTGNGNGTMGKLDVATGDIKVYDMPAPAARDPHTAIVDRNGIVWFTLQHSNMVGRLDPKTGETKLATMPTPKSRPYGIKLSAQGVPWVACNGSNCLVRIDPETMELREYPLPHEDTHVRRLDFAGDGMIWYVNSGRGRLGRMNPKTGEVKEWPSPSGPDSHPYAIAVIDGIVWYNESGMRPDPLVRFDPKTEKFQSWAIPSGGVYAGIVRHMRPTRDGNLLIHQSATNRIILVKLKG